MVPPTRCHDSDIDSYTPAKRIWSNSVLVHHTRSHAIIIRGLYAELLGLHCGIPSYAVACIGGNHSWISRVSSAACTRSAEAQRVSYS